jgi:hypothetical protein
MTWFSPESPVESSAERFIGLLQHVKVPPPGRVTSTVLPQLEQT